MFPYRRLLLHWPLIIVVIFSALTLELLWSLYGSQSLLKVSTSTRLVADSQRRAEVVADTLAERRQAVVDLADSHEIEAYLVSEALGMSAQYGLEAILGSIEQRFLQEIQTKTRRGEPVYTRIVFLGRDGVVLAQSGNDGRAAALPTVSERSTRVSVDFNNWRIIASEPVIYKGVPSGAVVTVSDLSLVSRLLILSGSTEQTAEKYQEFLLDDEGNSIAAHEQSTALARHVALAFASLPENTLASTTAVSRADRFRGLLALRTPIRNSPLSMLTLASETEVYGQLASPVYFIFLGGFSAALLVAAFQFERMRRRAVKLQDEYTASDRHRAGLLQRNEALSAEIARRKELEAALHDKTGELDKTNEALQASRDRLETAVQATNDGLWDWNLESDEVYYSPRWKSMLGYASDELGTTLDVFVQLVDPEQRDAVFRQVSDYRSGKIPGFEIEFRMLHKEGHWVDILSRAMLTSPAASLSRSPNRLIGTHVDISRHKLTEGDLRIAATAFESQEGMFITDARGVILRVNRAFTEITGYAAHEAIGQTQALLESGRHDCAFLDAIGASIRDTGAWKGEIWNRRKNGEVHPDWLTVTAVMGEGIVTHYVATLTDISARKVAEEEILHLALYDQLTKLPNRRLLLDRLGQALALSTRNGHRGALLFIDLDNFKTLNDTQGHHMGDLLLKQVALRLSGCVRESDTVARLGGDEFVIMLEGLSSDASNAAAEIEGAGAKILAVLNESYLLAGQYFHSSASIGAAQFSGHTIAVEDLLRQADLAMYQSKAAGRNCLHFFNPEMQAEVIARAAIEADLREAILKEQFLLHYQAQVAHDEHLSGAEVLVRWKHPERGLVPPADFIAIAESTGLILPLGQWVLDTACRQIRSWASAPEFAHLTLSVNVSARQFHDHDFVNQVIAVLDRTGANPHRLKLELTESLLVSNVEDVIVKMRALKARGVGFALDDFGTGYSSLSYLSRLPLDQLKIDRSFVMNIESSASAAAICAATISLAHNLKLQVIAEGVETEGQRHFLNTENRCDAIQGYLYSRPLPLDDFEAFVHCFEREQLVS
jgi:diguanylate cyclase (GGDEF)-like protein/PAS domain S-box-containing protein